MPPDADHRLRADHPVAVRYPRGAGAGVVGGAGSAVAEALQAAGIVMPVLQLGLPDAFIEHGDPARLLAMQGLDAAGIEASIVRRFAGIIEAGRPALKAVA
jgi:1-deoxy-D-xylulose-5-phosphate synthase